MKISDMTGGKFLKSSDVDEPIRTVIESVVEETMNDLKTGQPTQKPVMRCRGITKPICLSAKRDQILALQSLLGGVTTEDWIGKEIEVYRDENVTDMTGKRVGGIRFRKPSAMTAEQAVKEAAKVGLTKDDIKKCLADNGCKGWDKKAAEAVQAMIEAAVVFGNAKDPSENWDADPTAKKPLEEIFG